MMIFSGEYFYSIAAIFSASAYLLGNILWLRILLVIAAIFYIISGISLGITSMIGWNSAYLAINFYHIILLLLDRVTINLPVDTKSIYHQFFSSLSTREFKKLIMTNKFGLSQNSIIIQQSERTDKLYIILKGQVIIVRADRVIATLSAGDLIGEMSFMSKEPASASAISQGIVEFAYWTHNDLDKLKAKNIDTYNRFISIIGCDLVRKLKVKNNAGDLSVKEVDFIV